tara:strand:- start:5052 stop:6656 length:1605 start_codon:yes stop_codon:yes gene_type:complete
MAVHTATPKFLSSSTNQTQSGTGVVDGSGLSTGDLRRRYDFSERFTELSISQTPFFRLVSQIAKSPTDDPQFKYTEKRGSIHKRYAYVVGFDDDGGAKFNQATLTAQNDGGTDIEAGDVLRLYMATDYKSDGNIQNISGQATGAIGVGSAGTAPDFFLTNQIVKINLSETDGGDTSISDYILMRVTAVGAKIDVGTDASNVTGSQTLTGAVDVRRIDGIVVRAVSTSAAKELTSFSSNAPDLTVYNEDIATSLEAKRCHVVGSAYAEGSSLSDETWNDNPYSTSYGQTQIFRTEFGMTNTARATALKYEPNEWARIWRDKLVEHKWDIEQAALFSKQTSTGSSNSTVYYTQGAIDFVGLSGNSFSLNLATKTSDDFLDDMSKYMDPRYNSGSASVYFCDTATYNWLLKVGSGSHNAMFANIVHDSQDNYAGRFDFAVAGKKSLFGLDLTTISTPYGDISVSRCISLDHSAVKILGVNMKHVKYRPLVGNGVNRDTAVYVGVQSLENTGTDKRVDMILTEGGFEWSMPEAHAIWK